MTSISVHQAVFRRKDDDHPTLLARSPAFADLWVSEAEKIVVGFGVRPGGVACPLAVFALPLTAREIAVVRVADQPDNVGRSLAFHFLVVERRAYERYAGDPFAFLQRFPTVWETRGELPEATMTTEPPAPRTVAEVQRVLRRVKASALKEDEDPEAPAFERTAENSESPALLGGVQVLVDGGKLIFTRSKPDMSLLEGLWTLLPYGTRGKLWPASFAFSNDLGFDVVVLPRANLADFEGYTTEDQAAEYPPGSYELALQTAAEAGDQRDLDAVFRRRNSGETLRMALWLLLGMMLIMIASRWFSSPLERPVDWVERAAGAAGIVAVGDPWTAAAMLEHGERLWGPKR